MTFDQIVKVNQTITLTPIQGKGYADVNQRIKAFRMLIPDGSIETDMISNVDGVCVFRAVIKDGIGKILGTGTAYEKEGNGFINRTSYIENCETSAVGRALAMCGIGIDTSVASYEEVANAKMNQEEPEKKQGDKKKAEDKKQPENGSQAVQEASAKAKVLAYINRHQMSEDAIAKICKAYRIGSIHELTLQHCNHYIKALEKNGGNIDE